MSWALVLATPLMIVLTALAVAQGTAVQWLAFVYLSVVSMYLGFVAWYRGLRSAL